MIKQDHKKVVMLSGTLKDGSPFSFPMVVQGGESSDKLEHLARCMVTNAFLQAPATLNFHFHNGE
jgi:hypothetical protein